jgi:hypothetical protein
LAAGWTASAAGAVGRDRRGRRRHDLRGERQRRCDAKGPDRFAHGLGCIG